MNNITPPEHEAGETPSGLEWEQAESVHAHDLGTWAAVGIGALSVTGGMLAAYLRAKFLK
jgi:hypothetical protein